MTAPFFTSNDSDLTQLEGLYIQEQNPPAIVQGISLNIVGIDGECVRGPNDTAVLITSQGQFTSIFGGRDFTANGSGGARIGLVHAALMNKRFGAVMVVRTVASDAVKASFTVETASGGGGTQIARIDAFGFGTHGNNIGTKVSAATSGISTQWNLTVRYLGNDITYANLDTSTGTDNTASIIGTDPSRLIQITKLADGRPVNNAASTDGADTNGFVFLGTTVSGYTNVVGSNGTIADTDFTGAGKGMEILQATKGIAVCFVAERSSAAIKSKIALLAANAVDRIWLCGADTSSTSVSAAITDVALNRSDRIVYCYDHPLTTDPDTGTIVTVRPESWLASIMSQTDVDIHVGDEDNKTYTAAITSLTNESLQRADYIFLKAAGICALEDDDGFSFVSGVTSLLTSGKTEIARRRETDYLQLSLAVELKHSVKKKNTPARRKANAALIQGFLNDLKKQQRIVADFSVDTESLNTVNGRASGLEKILLRVQLIGHILYLDLVTQIGVSVTFQSL